MGVSLVWEGGRVLGCGGTGWTTATTSCYSWSPRRPHAWRREASLVARRAFGLLVVEQGLVHMVRGWGPGRCRWVGWTAPRTPWPGGRPGGGRPCTPVLGDRRATHQVREGSFNKSNIIPLLPMGVCANLIVVSFL